MIRLVLDRNIILFNFRIHISVTCSAHHVTIVGPRPELHETLLFVEGKELDVDLARRFVDGRRVPGHFAGVVEDRLRHDRHLVIAVGAKS